jgi:hypothetical protein
MDETATYLSRIHMTLEGMDRVLRTGTDIGRQHALERALEGIAKQLRDIDGWLQSIDNTLHKMNHKLGN